MEIFIGRLRKVLNHLTRERHVDFHKKIAEAAERRFKSVDDYLIQDWIDTENSYIKFSIGSPDPEDARCDADRTLLGSLNNIRSHNELSDNLDAFRNDIESVLDETDLISEYTIDTIDTIPWDGLFVLHTVLSRQLSMLSPMLKREKVFIKDQLERYVSASYKVKGSYFNFGGSILEADLKDCNEILKELYSSLVNYIGKARIKTSRRFMESKEILAHIDRLIASI